MGRKITHSEVDDPTVKTWEMLAQIAQAVGMPISAFTAESNSELLKPLAEAKEDHMQALVRSYLNESNDDAKIRFFIFLETLKDTNKI